MKASSRCKGLRRMPAAGAARWGRFRREAEAQSQRATAGGSGRASGVVTGLAPRACHSQNGDSDSVPGPCRSRIGHFMMAAKAGPASERAAPGRGKCGAVPGTEYRPCRGSPRSPRAVERCRPRSESRAGIPRPSLGLASFRLCLQKPRKVREGKMRQVRKLLLFRSASGLEQLQSTLISNNAAQIE